MALDIADISKRIQAILGTVEGIGRVMEMRKFVIKDEEFKANYFVDRPDKKREINAWSISHASVTDTPIATNGWRERVHRFVIRGYLHLWPDEQTELKFNNIIERIGEKFPPSETLGGKILYCDPIQAELIDVAMMSDYSVHYCELALVLHEDVQGL